MEKKFTNFFVITFLINKANKNDYLFMDRYYSGIDIYLGLYEKGIKATGTIMTNKVNLPKENNCIFILSLEYSIHLL